MVTEQEFAGALAVMERHGNTLSSHIRRAWEGGILQTMTRASPIKATDAHISIIGHITPDELRARLTRTDIASGFANQFIFVCVRRSQLLPFGGEPIDGEIMRLGQKLNNAVTFAKTVGRLFMTDSAKAIWKKAYPRLSNGGGGLSGAITARAAAQSMRLAMIYALLDHSRQIDEPHLKAGLAVWEYGEASAKYIFGDCLGDPVADQILTALRQAGDVGMTRTAISGIFGRNEVAGRISNALVLLLGKGKARMGNQSERWPPDRDLVCSHRRLTWADLQTYSTRRRSGPRSTK